MLKIISMSKANLERTCKTTEMSRWTAYIPAETKRDIETLKNEFKIAKYLRSVIVAAVEDIKCGRIKESA